LNLFELSLQLDSKGGIMKKNRILISIIFLDLSMSSSNRYCALFAINYVYAEMSEAKP
jgi:hypothetical protein